MVGRARVVSDGRAGALYLGGRLDRLAIIPCAVANLAISYHPRLLRWTFFGILLNIALSGFVTVGLSFSVGMPDLALASIPMVTYFAFLAFRLHPLQGIVSVSPFIAFHWTLVVAAVHDGRLSSHAFWSYFLLPLIVLGLGASPAGCSSVCRARRTARSVIEAQREIIERLQRAEVQRQVAERSRGLSEAISRLADAPQTPTRLAGGDVVEGR